MKSDNHVFLRLAVAASTFMGVMAGSASATMITGVTIDSVSSEWGDRVAANTVNGSGLVTDGATLKHDGVTSHMWLSNAELQPTTVFDLQAVQTVAQLIQWNYNENPPGFDPALTARGLNSVDIYKSTDNNSWDLVDNFTFNQATSSPGSDPSDPATYTVGQTIDLPDFSARYIKFEVQSNWGDSSFSGMSEVQFFAVPEPASLGLMAIGAMCLLPRRWMRR